MPPSPVEMRPQRRIDAARRVLLHAGDKMAVDVEGDRDAGMPSPLACHLRVNALGEKVADVGVPEAVEHIC